MSILCVSLPMRAAYCDQKTYHDISQSFFQYHNILSQYYFVFNIHKSTGYLVNIINNMLIIKNSTCLYILFNFLTENLEKLKYNIYFFQIM